MEKNKMEQAEKLQIKLDSLLQSREKKQAVLDKTKNELTAISKNIDSTKLKLFEILQSGSDDNEFSNWAKQKISENDNSENGNSANRENGKSENPNSVNHENSKSANPQNTTPPSTQNYNHHDKQNQPPHTGQNHQPRTHQT